MSKITKKQLHNGWHCHDTEIIKMKKELRELKQSVLRLEKLTDEKLLDESQLKQLDQSVFNGLDEKWRFAAVDKCGEVWCSTHKTQPSVSGTHLSPEPNADSMQAEGYYDASNWQNSLIERESKELTGSDLCRAMLARGDTRIMCKVFDIDRKHDVTHVIRAYSDGKFHTKANRWSYAVPINNQGEPLTASEAGL